MLCCWTGKIVLDKLYKAFTDMTDNQTSEFRINAKYALGMTTLGPGYGFDMHRLVQSFYSKFEAWIKRK